MDSVGGISAEYDYRVKVVLPAEIKDSQAGLPCAIDSLAADSLIEVSPILAEAAAGLCRFDLGFGSGMHAAVYDQAMAHGWERRCDGVCSAPRNGESTGKRCRPGCNCGVL